MHLHWLIDAASVAVAGTSATFARTANSCCVAAAAANDRVVVGVPMLAARYRVERIGRGAARSGARARCVRIVPEHITNVRLARVPVTRAAAHRAVQRFDALSHGLGVVAWQSGNAGGQLGGG